MEEKILKLAEVFKEKTKKECYKVTVVDGEVGILDDKLGGNPYLPVGEEYPKDKSGEYMPLLLQVNLKNVDLKGYPKKGILEIFTDKALNWPCEYAIKYFEEGLEYQTEFPEIDVSKYILNTSFKIELEKTIAHMPIGDYRFNDVLCSAANELFGCSYTDYFDLEEFFGDSKWFDSFYEKLNNPGIVIGGYADFTQTDPRDYELENKDECLFKLDSNYDYDVFYIGDSGILFALISQEDIEECKFEEAVVDWDCC